MGVIAPTHWGRTVSTSSPVAARRRGSEAADADVAIGVIFERGERAVEDADAPAGPRRDESTINPGRGHGRETRAGRGGEVLGAVVEGEVAPAIVRHLAGGCATAARVFAGVEDGGVEPTRGELLRQDETGNAAADHGDLRNVPHPRSRREL